MRTSRAIGALAAGLSLISSVTVADGPCGPLYFTTASDFSGEFWVNLNTLNDSGGTVNQVGVNKKPQPLPYVWVAISGVVTNQTVRTGTLVRIDTETGSILGEYRTAPFGRGQNPSRTTVDLTGRCWSGNRFEGAAPPEICPEPPCIPTPGSVVQVGTLIGGTRGIKNPDGSFTPSSDGEYLKEPFDYCTCVDRVDPDGNPPDGLTGAVSLPN